MTSAWEVIGQSFDALANDYLAYYQSSGDKDGTREFFTFLQSGDLRSLTIEVAIAEYGNFRSNLVNTGFEVTSPDVSVLHDAVAAQAAEQATMRPHIIFHPDPSLFIRQPSVFERALHWFERLIGVN